MKASGVPDCASAGCGMPDFSPAMRSQTKVWHTTLLIRSGKIRLDARRLPAIHAGGSLRRGSLHDAGDRARFGLDVEFALGAPAPKRQRESFLPLQGLDERRAPGLLGGVLLQVCLGARVERALDLREHARDARSGLAHRDR